MSCVYGIQEVRGSIPLSSTINIRLCADFFYVFLLKIYLRKTTRCGALQVLTETQLSFNFFQIVHWHTKRRIVLI